ncbi:hypothetical protein PCC7418_0558 [Halothece sp. PCC 7418]|uniref:hypothetical protein n=1 Tax=Halothece sp. (strain PCC 7418) TaxID=65093 RepID=UPI0002A086BE|nr:hypothetical protein [Halothece sp. PCC 7418]AFZ42787.1 hypothetical protein PCC7418_0558 [Halothece sp. PCC 7418]
MPTQALSTQQKQEQIYEHLKACVQKETPEEVLGRYHRLFVQATGYEDPEIREALEQIVKEEEKNKNFSSFVSYCCYLAINYWLTQDAEAQQAIGDLVQNFQEIPPFARSQTMASRRIREKVSEFSKSDYFLRMQRLRTLLITDEETQRDKSQPLSAILGRYPFLFQDCILPQDNYPETKRTLKKFQVKQQQDFEASLANYITNQVRLSRLAKRYNCWEKAQESITAIPNPTLLKEPELISTLQHFISGVQGTSTYQDLAKRFITHSSKADTFKIYKRDLYEYLVNSLDGDYVKKQFRKRLSTYLKNTLVDWDRQKPNEQLMLRVANNLLKFLVVESRQNIDHYLYLDLITHLGPTQTVGLLLKIMLLSNKINPYLMSRFAILYNHYENVPRHNVHWLFKSLENLKIALTIHNSTVDLSYWRSVNSLSV